MADLFTRINTLKEEAAKEKALRETPLTKSPMEAGLTVGNAFYQQAANPELRGNNNYDDEAFSWSAPETQQFLKDLQTEDPRLLNGLHRANNQEYLELMVARNRDGLEAERTFAEHPVMSGVSAFAGAIADPTILVPGSLLYRGAKSLSTMKGIATGTTLGATANVAAEFELDALTSNRADYGNAILWGASAGGLLGGLHNLVGNAGIRQQQAADLLTKPDQIELGLRKSAGDTSPEVADIPTAKDMPDESDYGNQIWGHLKPRVRGQLSKFNISSVSRLAATKYHAFNDMAAKLVRSPYARQAEIIDEAGNTVTVPIPQGVTAQDIKFRLKTQLNIFDAHLEDSYRAMRNEGYRGSQKEFSNLVEQERKAAVQEALDEVYDELDAMDAAYRIPQEQLQAEFDKMFKEANDRLLTRLNKRFAEGKIDETQYRTFLERDQRKITERINTALETKSRNAKMPMQEYNKAFNELVNKREINTSRMHPEVKKSVDAMTDYYRAVAKKGREVGLKLDDESSNLYHTRRWNLDAIRKLPKAEVMARLKRAIGKHRVNVRNMEGMSKKNRTKLINKLAESMYKKLSNTELMRDVAKSDLIKTTYTPLGSNLKIKARLLDSELDGLLHKGTNDILSNYNYQMSGRIGLHAVIGDKNVQDVVNDISQQARLEGATPKEIEILSADLLHQMESILGTASIPKNPNGFTQTATRMLGKFEYGVFGGGFGFNALFELGAGAMAHGLRNTMANLRPALHAVRKGMVEGPDKYKFIQDALSLGAAHEFYNINMISRMDDIDSMFSSNSVERALDEANRFVTKYSGLSHITTMYRVAALGAGTVDLIKNAKRYAKSGKINKGYMDKLARYGLQPDDLLWIAEQPVLSKSRQLVDFQFEKWDNPKRVEKFQIAATAMMDDAVLTGDTTLLPRLFSSTNPMAQMMTKFLRFPTLAYEQLLRKGVAEDPAKFMVGVMTSASMASMIYYLREAALIELGAVDEADAKYQILDKDGDFDDEALQRLALVVLTKMPQASFMADAIKGSAQLTGTEIMGSNEFKQDLVSANLGPSIQRILDLSENIPKILNGDFSKKDAYYMAKSYTLFQNLLTIDQIYNPIIKENLR